jgi:hypothetical protein
MGIHSNIKGVSKIHGITSGMSSSYGDNKNSLYHHRSSLCPLSSILKEHDISETRSVSINRRKGREAAIECGPKELITIIGNLSH